MKKNLSTPASIKEDVTCEEVLKTDQDNELIHGLLQNKKVEFEYDYFMGQGTCITMDNLEAIIDCNNHEFKVQKGDINTYEQSDVDFVLSVWEVTDELKALLPKIPPGNLENFGGTKKLAQEFWNVNQAKKYANSPAWNDKDNQ